eukprot:6209223-Pleurochrysis_carterae.AAC.2
MHKGQYARTPTSRRMRLRPFKRPPARPPVWASFRVLRAFRPARSHKTRGAGVAAHPPQPCKNR